MTWNCGYLSRVHAALAAIAIGLAAFQMTPSHADGIDLGAAVNSGATPDEWITSTVKNNREAWKPRDEIPDELFAVFNGAPFSEYLRNYMAEHKRELCDMAALNMAWNALNKWELANASAAGAVAQFLKRWGGRAKAVYDIATGGPIVEQVKGVAKDVAKDIGKDAAKDTVRTGDPAIQQKIEDKVKDAYNRIRDVFKDGPRAFWDVQSAGPCSVAMIWVFGNNTLDLYMYGSCGCATVTDGNGHVKKMNSFALHIESKTYIDKDNGELTVSVSDGIKLVELKANCNCPTQGGNTVAPPALPPVVPPRAYIPVDGKRTTCEPCKDKLKKVLALQQQIKETHDAVDALLEDQRAGESGIRSAKDNGREPPADLVTRAKNDQQQAHILGNKEIQLTGAWRIAIKDLEDCEQKICKEKTATGTGTGTGSQPPPNKRPRLTRGTPTSTRATSNNRRGGGDEEAKTERAGRDGSAILQTGIGLGIGVLVGPRGHGSQHLDQSSRGYQLNRGGDRGVSPRFTPRELMPPIFR